MRSLSSIASTRSDPLGLHTSFACLTKFWPTYSSRFRRCSHLPTVGVQQAFVWGGSGSHTSAHGSESSCWTLPSCLRKAIRTFPVYRDTSRSRLILKKKLFSLFHLHHVQELAHCTDMFYQLTRLVPSVPSKDYINSMTDIARTGRMLESADLLAYSRIWVLSRGHAVHHLVKLMEISSVLGRLPSLKELRVAVEIEQYDAGCFFA